MSSESGYTEYIKPDEPEDKEGKDNDQQSRDSAGYQFFSGIEFLRVSGAHEYLESAEKNKEECNASADADSDLKNLADKLLRISLDAPQCGPGARPVAHAIFTVFLFL
jgi:hypothetical protein